MKKKVKLPVKKKKVKKQKSEVGIRFDQETRRRHKLFKKKWLKKKAKEEKRKRIQRKSDLISLKKLLKKRLKKWKASKQLQKEWTEPTINKQLLVIETYKRLVPIEEPQRDFKSFYKAMKRAAKKNGTTLSDKKVLKQRWRNNKKLEEEKREAELAVIRKARKRRQKEEKLLRQERYKEVECGQTDCTRKEWIPNDAKEIVACSLCTQRIMSGKKPDTFEGYTPKKRKRIKKLWKKRKKKLKENLKKDKLNG